MEELQLFRRADYQPKHGGIGIVEHLPQGVGADQDTAVARYRQSCIADPHAAGAVQYKIKLFRADVFVQCIGAPGWQAPESRPQDFAPGALEIIRVWNLHQVGRSPMEGVRFDEMITLDGLHGWRLCSVPRCAVQLFWSAWLTIASRTGQTARSVILNSCEAQPVRRRSVRSHIGIQGGGAQIHEKTIMKLLRISYAMAGAFVAAAASATTAFGPEPAEALRPKPLVVVDPVNLPRSFTGGTIDVEFSLDGDGRPRDVRLSSASDATVKEQILKAFSRWRFSPVARPPAGRSRRFVLPLEVRPQE